MTPLVLGSGSSPTAQDSAEEAASAAPGWHRSGHGGAFWSVDGRNVMARRKRADLYPSGGLLLSCTWGSPFRQYPGLMKIHLLITDVGY